MLALNLSAQDKKSEPADSLVRLMSAQSAQMVQNDDGTAIRKVIGPARFLHNGTYLICDTAFWYVDDRVIKAFGHVKILQDETVLTSEKLNYYIDNNVAQFRGTVVQLQDKDRNTLRTHNLDYNTKDSVATFQMGGAMRDKDGQVMESEYGSYDSKTKIFTFIHHVNMYADSVFINSESLIYHGDTQLAEFSKGVDAWKDDDMLSSDRGYYNRNEEVFRFYDNVHGMSDTQEGWADTLHFYRSTKDIELMGNVQMTDTSRAVSGLAERVFYVDSLKRITMEGNATVVAEIEDTTARDTVYMAADRMVYQTILMCDVDPSEVSAAQKRLTDLETDPVAEYRKKAAEAAAAAAEEAKRKREEEMGIKKPSEGTEPQEPASVSEPPAEPEPEPEPVAPGEPVEPAEPAEPVEPTEPAEPVEAAEPAEQIEEAEPSDPDAEAQEPEASVEEKDTTKVGFLMAVGQVRVFKSDMQARCDSLAYNDLDSLGRLYIDPVVWNEGNRQYSSDSLSIVSENGHMRRANLMSNAFITIQEDSISFDQIRGAEMTAFFDTTSALERFDALGGASAVFFLEENDALATVNKVDSKMLSANFVGGEIDRIYYYDSPHNDAYPAVQLPSDDRRMKGFKWDPDRRPTGKEDITPFDIRPVERAAYAKRERPVFEETDVYFPGYMEAVYKGIATRDSLRRIAAMSAPEESVPFPQDTLSEADTLNQAGAVQEEPQTQSEEPTVTETAPQEQQPSSAADSTNTVEVDLKDLPELAKEQQRQAREAERAAKAAKKDAKWAELDARDAAKAEAKAAKTLEKNRRKAAKLSAAMEKEAARDQKIRDRYIKRYQHKKTVEATRAADAEARRRQKEK